MEREPWLVPVRMLNEFAYCPRLFYLEWVQGDFRDNPDTVDGRHQHRRVDREGGPLADPGAAADQIHARSVSLDAPGVGLTTRIDLVEGEDGVVSPVDYKRGRKPDIPEGAWEPERVQVCAQALVLRENGYDCREGAIYFVESKERVAVPIDDSLAARTRDLLAGLRNAAAEPLPPPPLVDSPKCVRCSLAPICLPDETNLLRGDVSEEVVLRQLLPARDDALPLYVQEPGSRIGKDHGVLRVTPRDGDPVEVRLAETSSVALFGAVQISAQAIGELCDRGIPIGHFTGGGWFRGLTTGLPANDVALRRAQARAADDPALCLELARGFVFAKIRNCRTMVRRNHEAPPAQALGELARLARGARRAPRIESLLGVEGAAARLYFSLLAGMLRPRQEWPGLDLDFDGRNRRPPRDPVNALLSLAYAILAKTFTVTAFSVGLDPLLGFYHQPRFARPALALDLMEEFRPLVADSAVITAINTGVIGPTDFVRRGGACALTPPGRARFLDTLEARLGQEITHPTFGYRISYRRVFEVQARLLGRRLTGEIRRLPPFLTR